MEIVCVEGAGAVVKEGSWREKKGGINRSLGEP